MGEQVVGAEGLEHPPRLLGRGVARHPRVVRPDRQDGEIDRAALPVPRQDIGVGRVAAEQHRVAALPEQVSAPAAVPVGDHAGPQ